MNESTDINAKLTVIQPDWKRVKQFFTNHIPHPGEYNKVEVGARRVIPLPGDDVTIQLDLYCPSCDTLICANHGRYKSFKEAEG